MKTETLIKRYAFIALLISLVLLSVSVVFVTYRYYGVVARGILGLVMLYLLYIYGRYSKMDVSLDSLLLAPNKGKYLISAFIGGIISYWATMQILEVVLFFWKR